MIKENVGEKCIIKEEESKKNFFSYLIELFSIQNNNFEIINSFPKLGLFRNYQEQWMELIGNYTKMFVASMEYFNLLLSPVEHTNITNTKEPYNEWIAKLDKSYQELLRSNEYLTVLYKTINTFEGLFSSFQNVINSWLYVSGQISPRDFDELIKENYQIKRELRALKSKVKKHDKFLNANLKNKYNLINKVQVKEEVA